MSDVSVEIGGDGVAQLRLSRPEKHNALSEEMIGLLHEAAEALGADDAVRVVVLSAEGRTFCAGGDLRWMQAQIAAGPEERREAAMRLATMLQAVNTMPKPLIARVQGNAFGGGVGLLSCCDVVIAVEGAKFGLTETRLGLIPATIGPYVAARMGEARARRVFMSSRIFDAAEARDLGLVARVVEQDALDAAIGEEVAPYFACAPGAVGLAKRMLRDLGPEISMDQIEASVDMLVAAWDGEEAASGLDAFFAKRPPPWAG